jgi:hypothetical protein
LEKGFIGLNEGTLEDTANGIILEKSKYLADYMKR